jgi:hypothetical protein
MGISKIIFRIDYLPAFKVFDSPGLALKIMNQDGKYEWNGFSDDSSKRQVGSAKQSKEEGYSLNLNCSPICIDGTLINHKGIAFEHVDKNDDLIRLITITNSLRDEYEIFQLKRSGIRLFYFNDLKLGSEIVKERFAALIDKTLVKNIISELGKIDDIMISFDGEGEDKLKYHFRSGPYFSHEAKKYIEFFPEEFVKTSVYDMVVDLDIYEENFELRKNVSYMKWCNGAFKKAIKIISGLEKSLIEAK